MFRSLVDLAALNERGLAEDRAHGLVQRQRAIEDHQQAAVGAQATALQIGRAGPGQTAAFSVAPSHSPSACFWPSAAIPSATIRQCSPMCTPSISSATRSRPSREAVCHAASCAVVFATKRRLTLLLLVPATAHRPPAPAPGSAHTGAWRRPPASARPPADSTGRHRARAWNVGSGTSWPSARTRGRATATFRPPSTTSLRHRARARGGRARPCAHTADHTGRCDLPRASRPTPAGQTGPSARTARLRVSTSRSTSGRVGRGRFNNGDRTGLCETSSWRLLVGGLAPGASHHSCTTSSEEPPLSNFNSQWECAGALTNGTRVQVPPDEGRSRPVGTESCGRRGNAGSEA